MLTNPQISFWISDEFWQNFQNSERVSIRILLFKSSIGSIAGPSNFSTLTRSRRESLRPEQRPRSPSRTSPPLASSRTCLSRSPCPPALPKMTGVLPKTKNPYFLENYFAIFGNPPTPNVWELMKSRKFFTNFEKNVEIPKNSHQNQYEKRWIW